jgi:Siphovirus ReqiPepy6 Gp37-like protein
VEYYTLNSLFQRDTVIENFSSFIWTERYSNVGDFQVITKSNRENRQLLAVGTWITRLGSHYVMKIETVSDAIDDNGARNLTVTGRSMEALLLDRVAMPVLTDTTTQPAWVITGTPGDVVREMFTTVCVTGALDAHDTIPFYHSGSLLPTGSLGEDSSVITVTAEPDYLFNTIKKICDTYFLGFRLVKNGDASQIYFEVYVGNDLTSAQTDRNPVIFDSNMDNLAATSLLTSDALLKTVAYVFAKNGTAVVFSLNADPSSSGADRRVLLVNSNNDADAGPDLTAALQVEGQLALTGQDLIYAFDGELPQDSQYIYGVHYGLGDLVEERSDGGFGNQMIVTEQIFVSDDKGERAYPTLIIKQVITPNTWFTYDPDQTWSEVDVNEDWEDLPT